MMPSEAGPAPTSATVQSLSAAPPHFRAATAASKARLAEMLGTHFSAVLRFVRRFGVSEDSVDDAAQEVFIVAARRLEEIELGRERPFLYGIALRVAANARRALATRREEPGGAALSRAVSRTPQPDALLEQKRLRELLDQALETLSEELRAAFVLFEFEGFSVPEVAELCGIPVGTAASRLRRAREAFQTEAALLKERVRPSGGTP
jgi:RNA polymerase sigma-70 factor (ECF subfamily)